MAAMTREGIACIQGIVVVRISTIVMIGFAVLFGLLAVFIAQSWLNSQAEMRMRSLEANKKTDRDADDRGREQAAALRRRARLVVAARDRVAGRRGPDRRLREDLRSDWRPAAASCSPRIEANEPVLSSKITGPGQRATLSAMIGDGMRAVTIRVNDVEGVAGFVLPGDRVDVALTRQADKSAAPTTSCCRTSRCWRSTRPPTSAPTSRRSRAR